MADNHAYVPAPGTIVPVITQFRKSFPTTVTADTLKKLGFAPKNESYVLNVLRYLGFLDEKGTRTDIAAQIFSLHDDTEFSKAFSKQVKDAYKDLFDLFGDKAWALDTDQLITFFRQADQTSAITGKRQASTFQILTNFSGFGEMPQAKTTAQKKTTGVNEKKKEIKVVEPKKPDGQEKGKQGQPKPVGLTVRIEVNLPADGDQATYDRIFKSIRENLLNG
jgi:hypothetical protein